MRIVIDGNIGSGKTTQLKILQDKGYTVYKEPIEDWPLELFYSDPKKWAFNLQISILKSFASAPPKQIYERCCESSKEVFWKNLTETYNIPDIDSLMYNSLYFEYAWKPNVVIYLSSTPTACLKRISSRRQTGDDSIELDYLAQLNSKYEYLYNTRRFFGPKVHIVYVDGKESSEIHHEILSLLKLYRCDARPSR
jgi:hypothetical protein